MKNEKFNVKTSGLCQHAKKELELAGLFDKDSDYNGMIGKDVYKLIQVFAAQGHSGNSAQTVIQFFNTLSNQQNIIPLTNDPKEWEYKKECGLFQNKRNSACMSDDNLLSYYNVNDSASIKYLLKNIYTSVSNTEFYKEVLLQRYPNDEHLIEAFNEEDFSINPVTTVFDAKTFEYIFNINFVLYRISIKELHALAKKKGILIVKKPKKSNE